MKTVFYLFFIILITSSQDSISQMSTSGMTIYLERAVRGRRVTTSQTRDIQASLPFVKEILSVDFYNKFAMQLDTNIIHSEQWRSLA